MRPWRGMSIEGNKAIPTKHSSSSARLATLQDYWRVIDKTGRILDDRELEKLNYLVEHDGKVYNIAHCPTQTLSKYHEYPNLIDLIKVKLQLADNSRVDNFSPDGKYETHDGRALFNGCILDNLFLLDPNNLNISCDGAAFLNRLNLKSITLGSQASFRRCLFLKGFYFSGNSEGDIDLSAILSLDDINLSFASIQGSMKLQYATVFGGIDAQNSSCELLEFGGAKIAEKLWLQRHECRSHANMYWMEIGGNAEFENIDISGNFTFSYSIVNGMTDLAAAKFRGNAIFDNVQFSGKILSKQNRIWARDDARTIFDSKSSFKNAVFREEADFTRFRWQGDFNDVFEHAEFHKALIWPWAQAHAYAALAGARIYGSLKYHSFGQKLDNYLFHKRSLPAAVARGQRGIRSLKSGLRAIRNYYSNYKDREREAHFYKLELKVRSLDNNTSLIDRFAERIYGLVSQYGYSLSRPFIVLKFTSVIFFIVYVIIEQNSSSSNLSNIALNINYEWHPSVKRAAEITFNNMLGPLPYIFSEQLFAIDATEQRSLFYRISIGAVSIIHQCASTILIFLSILAARRKFQLD